MEDKRMIKGVGGWLLFFIITIVFIQPIVYLYSFIQYESFFHLLLLTFSLVAGINLWKVNKGAVKIAKAYLLTLVGVGLLDVILICQGDPKIDCAYFFGRQSLSIFIYPTIWYTYLSKSKRVQNTYSKDKGNQKKSKYNKWVDKMYEKRG